MYGDNQTEIYLTNIEWSKDYKDVLKFRTQTDQINWFKLNPKTIKLDTDYRFIDGDGNSSQHNINIAMKPETAQGYNYLFYKNDTDYTFCFIDSVDFVNYETSLVHLTEDIMQSYMFKYDLGYSFVKNETTPQDNLTFSLFSHSVYDNGEKFIRSTSSVLDRSTYLPFIYCFAFYGIHRGLTPEIEVKIEDSKITDGNISRLGAIIVFANFDDLYNTLHYWEVNKGLVLKDSIAQMGMISKSCCPAPMIIKDKSYTTENSIEIFNKTYNIYSFDDINSGVLWGDNSFTVTRPQSLKLRNGSFYSPRNKKLLNAPFLQFNISSFNNYIPFKFEDFENPDSVKFKYRFAFTDSFHCYAFPQDYKGKSGNNIEHVIEIPVATTVPFTVDGFQEWFNQNKASLESKQNQLTLSYLKSIGSVIGGAIMIAGAGATGGSSAVMGAGMVGTGISGIVDTGMTQKDLSQSIVDARNSNGYIDLGNVTDSMFEILSTVEPKVYIVQADGTFLSRIDNFYSVYGYEVSQFKIPNLNTREKWNYIQTEKTTIIPSSTAFMNAGLQIEIMNIFNSGVTFWHTYTKNGEWNFNNYFDYGEFINPVRS